MIGLVIFKYPDSGLGIFESNVYQSELSTVSLSGEFYMIWSFSDLVLGPEQVVQFVRVGDTLRMLILILSGSTLLVDS